MAKRKSKKKVFIIIFFIAIAIFVVAGFVMNNKGPVKIKVTTSKVMKKTITQTVHAIGKIEPEIEVKISPEISGEIIYLGVREGDIVKANQLLVRIKPDIIETQLEQFKAAADAAEMDIKVSKAEMERVKNDLHRKTQLYEKEFVSEQEFDLARTAYEQAVSRHKASLLQYDRAMASYKQILRNAARTTIYSPIEGIVTRLNVEKGEKVVGTEMMQGTEMMIISDLSVMNAVVDVPENDIIMVKTGDTAKIEVHAFQDDILYGTVVEIGHSANSASIASQDEVVNYKVKLRILGEESRLRRDLTCEVDIMTITKYDVLSVPRQSVTVREPDKDTLKTEEEEIDGIRVITDKTKRVKKERLPTVVFVKKGDVVRQTEVETGISDDDYMEITKGLDPGQEVVSGSFNVIAKELKDSSYVEIDTKKDKKK